MTTFLRKLLRQKDGAVAMEFALIMVFILLPMTFGIIEFGRAYVYAQKVAAVAHSQSDFLSQSNATVSAADIQTFGRAGEEVMKPFDYTGTSIFSGVRYVGVTPVVVWQSSYGAAGNASRIGNAGANATMPPGFTGQNGDFYVVTEVLQEYEPLLAVSGNIIPALNPQIYYRASFFRPRYSAEVLLQ